VQRPAPGPATQLAQYHAQAEESAKQRPVADGEADAELVGSRRAAAQLLQQADLGRDGEEVQAHKRGGIPPGE